MLDAENSFGKPNMGGSEQELEGKVAHERNPPTGPSLCRSESARVLSDYLIRLTCRTYWTCLAT